LTDCLVNWSIVMMENRIGRPKFRPFFCAQLHVTASLFSYNKLGWFFGLVKLIQSEQYPWYRRKWWASASFVISTYELSWVVEMSAVSFTNFVVCFWDNGVIPKALRYWNRNRCKLKPAQLCLYYDEVAWLF
jgi:hypothetical protein